MYGDDFLDTTPKAQSMKEITDKLDFIKIKNLCFAKNTVKRLNIQTTDWQKVFQKAHLIKDCNPKYTKNS